MSRRLLGLSFRQLILGGLRALTLLLSIEYPSLSSFLFFTAVPCAFAAAFVAIRAFRTNPKALELSFAGGILAAGAYCMSFWTVFNLSLDGTTPLSFTSGVEGKAVFAAALSQLAAVTGYLVANLLEDIANEQGISRNVQILLGSVAANVVGFVALLLTSAVRAGLQWSP